MSDDVMRQRLKKAADQITTGNKERLRKQSKDKLAKNLETKIRTTMIGAINKMEIFMGKEWGHGLPEDQCTDAQLDMYEMWQQCRNEILNLGNKQIRAALSELDLYSVEYVGYNINFKPIN